MTNVWQEVPLKEIAKPVARSIPVEAGTEYRTIGVKWWGMGAYERETIDGSRTAAKTLSIVREGDLIINKIWVRHGSVAIAGKDVDGCAGSGEFPTFELDLNRIEPRWIHWQTKMKSFWEKCDSLSRGTSGKNRIKPELFLTIKIPLPPLNEQHRILTGIETLAARIAKAQSLQEEAENEASALLLSILNSSFINLQTQFQTSSLEEVANIIGGNGISFSLDENNSKVGIMYVKVSDMNIVGNEKKLNQTAQAIPVDMTKGLRIIPIGATVLPKRGGAIATNKKRLLPKQAILDPNIMAIFPKEDSSLLAEYLYLWIMSINLSDLQNGTSVPQINKGDLAPLLIPVPPLDEQRRIVAYLDSVQARLASLRQLQSQTQEELDALLLSVLDRAFKGEL